MMQDDFFNNLPPENIIDILSRLPVKNILWCKCVRKSWIDLIESPEFLKLHLSRSASCLAVGEGIGHPYKIVEFVDDLDLKNSSCYYNLLFSFNFPSSIYLHSSVDGLLFTLTRDPPVQLTDLYICNPITREYFELPPLRTEYKIHGIPTQGFGVSKMTGQYKVVVIFDLEQTLTKTFAYTKCKVYTLGTLSWRSVIVDNPLCYIGEEGTFLNGNLHWVASDFPLISCFDLETEHFRTFSSPSNPMHGHVVTCCLSILSDCLCLCDCFEDVNVVWLMKKYGDEKSWTKEYIIKTPYGKDPWDFELPVKVFKDGDLLITSTHGLEHICYSKKNGTIQETKPFGAYRYFQSNASYTPSFLSLKRFAPGKEKKMFTMEIIAKGDTHANPSRAKVRPRSQSLLDCFVIKFFL